MEKDRIIFVMMTLWLAVSSAVFGYFHGWHLVQFQSPSSLSISSEIKMQSEFGIFHFLGEGCSCSEHIADYLLKRGPIGKVFEQVQIIGDMGTYPEQLTRAGYGVKQLSVAQVATEGLSAVPLLVVFDQNLNVQYAGGYTEGPITPFSEFQDLQVLADLGEAKKVAVLPIKGCAVSREYQKLLDPLGIKYAGVKNE